MDHRRITEAGYQTIRERLLWHGYVAGKQPFIFFREVVVAGRPIPVKVDFLAGEYLSGSLTNDALELYYAIKRGRLPP